MIDARKANHRQRFVIRSLYRRPMKQPQLKGLRTSPAGSPDVKVETDLDDLNALPDVDDAGGAADLVGHQNVAMTELIVIVFDVHRPLARERPVEAAAGDPAVAVVQPLKIEGATAGKCAAADVVFVAGDRKASAGIDQDGVEGIADPAGHAGEE